MTLHDHVPHPHVEARRMAGPVRTLEQHLTDDTRAVKRLNARLAVRITAGVGTMACAWLFCALALVSLPAAITSGSVLVIVAWIAQTLLQLTLLPVIMVGQNVQAKAADARAKQTYDDAEAILHELGQVAEHLGKQDAVLSTLAPSTGSGVDGAPTTAG